MFLDWIVDSDSIRMNIIWIISTEQTIQMLCYYCLTTQNENEQANEKKIKLFPTTCLLERFFMAMCCASHTHTHIEHWALNNHPRELSEAEKQSGSTITFYQLNIFVYINIASNIKFSQSVNESQAIMLSAITVAGALQAMARQRQPPRWLGVWVERKLVAITNSNMKNKSCMHALKIV